MCNVCMCVRGASGQRSSEELESQTVCHSTPHWELGPLEEQEVVLTAEPSLQQSAGRTLQPWPQDYKYTSDSYPRPSDSC